MLLVHVLQLPLHGLRLNLYFEHWLVVDIIVLIDDVGVDHLVVDDTEGGGVVAGLIVPLAPVG